MSENKKTELFDKWYNENYDEWAEGEEGVALREELEQAFKGGIAELENKIADIKANCDLAIEGRDIKIKELELELTVEKDQHQEEINLHLHAEDYIKELEKENARLTTNEKSLLAERKIIVKENAELKNKIEHRNCLDCSNHHSNIKLLKAKEIIALGLRVCETSSIEYFNLYQKQAEQFLKDVPETLKQGSR